VSLIKTRKHTALFLLVSYLVFNSSSSAAFEHFKSHITAEIFAALPLRLLPCDDAQKAAFVSTLNYMMLIEKKENLLRQHYYCYLMSPLYPMPGTDEEPR